MADGADDGLGPGHDAPQRFVLAEGNERDLAVLTPDVSIGREEEHAVVELSGQLPILELGLLRAADEEMGVRLDGQATHILSQLGVALHVPGHRCLWPYNQRWRIADSLPREARVALQNRRDMRSFPLAALRNIPLDDSHRYSFSVEAAGNDEEPVGGCSDDKDQAHAQ